MTTLLGRTPSRIKFDGLTDEQNAFLLSQPWYLETFPNDDERVRIVYTALNTKSRWFSREWNPVPWEFIKPK